MTADLTASLLAASPLLARCSQIAYHDAAQRAGELVGLGVGHPHILLYAPASGTQGFITRAHVGGRGVIVVAFRGSESAQDWLANLTLRRTRITKARWVHAGFWDAAQSVLSAVDYHLKLLATGFPEAEIHFTGHSLGGALALLAASELAASRPGYIHRMRVVTFGAPRVGNAVWRDHYNRALGDRTLRFVNEEDPVPRVPLALRGFRHVGLEVFCSAGGRIVCNPPLWAKLLSDALGLGTDWLRGRISIVADHAVENYVRFAQRAADNLVRELESPNLSEQ